MSGTTDHDHGAVSAIISGPDFLPYAAVSHCDNVQPSISRQGIKGTELPLSGSVWRDPIGWVTYGVLWLLLDWAEYEDHDTDRSLCVLPIYGLNHSDTQRNLQRERREDL